MKRETILILLFAVMALFFLSNTKAERYMTLDEAKTATATYYDILSRIAQTQGKNDEIRALGQMKVNNDLCKNKRIEVAYDIRHLFSSSKDTNVYISNYIGFFQDSVIKYKFNFNYSITKAEYFSAPGIKGLGDYKVPQFARVIVRKTYDSPSLPKTEIIDTVSFYTEEGYLCGIRSRFSGKTNSVRELLEMAANRYKDRKYEEAFSIYERIMDLVPRHQEASYRLGIMLYKNQGCEKKYSTRKERDTKAVEYWRMSDKGEKAIKYYTH